MGMSVAIHSAERHVTELDHLRLVFINCLREDGCQGGRLGARSKRRRGTERGQLARRGERFLDMARINTAVTTRDLAVRTEVEDASPEVNQCLETRSRIVQSRHHW
jgi:hypothetical protein